MLLSSDPSEGINHYHYFLFWHVCVSFNISSVSITHSVRNVILSQISHFHMVWMQTLYPECWLSLSFSVCRLIICMGKKMCHFTMLYYFPISSLFFIQYGACTIYCRRDQRLNSFLLTIWNSWSIIFKDERFGI